MYRTALILALLISCSTKEAKNVATQAGKAADTVFYEPIPEPPPLPVDLTRTDSSTIETHYRKDMGFIREFNRRDSFDVTYFKEFSYQAHELRVFGVLAGGNEKGIWEYYDAAGNRTTKDFGPWKRKDYPLEYE